MPDGRNVSLADFKLYVRSETTIDESLYLSALLAGEEAVDIELGRKMVVVTAGAPGLTARVFRPTGGNVLWLDDFTEMSTLVENGVTLVNGTDYVLEPFNNLSPAGVTVPYDRAVRYRANWYCDYPKATVTATARWGWASISSLVIEGTKIAGKAILEGRDIRHGLVALAESGGVSERDGLTIKRMVKAYRSHKSWGIA